MSNEPNGTEKPIVNPNTTVNGLNGMNEQNITQPVGNGPAVPEKTFPANVNEKE
jgi:hypothetical protein